MKFKVGDKVRCIKGGTYGAGWVLGRKFVVGKITTDTDVPIVWPDEDSNGIYVDSLELISPSNQTTMDIKEKFVLALTAEPKKSFRKAGITNGDDLLTDEGQNIFLTWLLHTKYADEFKTGVVDGLLKDQEAA